MRIFWAVVQRTQKYDDPIRIYRLKPMAQKVAEEMNRTSPWAFHSVVGLRQATPTEIVQHTERDGRAKE